MAYGLWNASRRLGERVWPSANLAVPIAVSPLVPLNCFMPIIGIGGVLLVLEGLRRIVFPE